MSAVLQVPQALISTILGLAAKLEMLGVAAGAGADPKVDNGAQRRQARAEIAHLLEKISADKVPEGWVITSTDDPLPGEVRVVSPAPRPAAPPLNVPAQMFDDAWIDDRSYGVLAGGEPTARQLKQLRSFAHAVRVRITGSLAPDQILSPRTGTAREEQCAPAAEHCTECNSDPYRPGGCNVYRCPNGRMAFFDSVASAPLPAKAEPAIHQVMVAEILPTQIWIENDIMGARHVVLQHEGCDAFTYASFHYDYRYTSNAGTFAAAEALARSLGARGDIEHRMRSLAVLVTPPHLFTTESATPATVPVAPPVGIRRLIDWHRGEACALRKVAEGRAMGEWKPEARALVVPQLIPDALRRRAEFHDAAASTLGNSTSPVTTPALEQSTKGHQ